MQWKTILESEILSNFNSLDGTREASLENRKIQIIKIWLYWDWCNTNVLKDAIIWNNLNDLACTHKTQHSLQTAAVLFNIQIKIQFESRMPLRVVPSLF